MATNCAVLMIGDRYFNKFGKNGQILTVSWWNHAKIYNIQDSDFEVHYRRDILRDFDLIVKKRKDVLFVEVDLKKCFSPKLVSALIVSGVNHGGHV